MPDDLLNKVGTFLIYAVIGLITVLVIGKILQIVL